MKNFLFQNHDGQSAIELAIFGSILMFIIAMIFRQGFNSGNFMEGQLKAERYAMSKALESSQSLSPARNSASAMIIEDRLAGDFAGKYGSRDRTAMISSSTATFSSQLFYPMDSQEPDSSLTRTDMVINGQKFTFTTAGFKTYDIPTTKGSLNDCGLGHPLNPQTGLRDTRCWKPDCVKDENNQDLGCVVFQRMVQNFPGSEFDPTNLQGFDLDFDGQPDIDPNANNPFVTDDNGQPIKYGQLNNGGTVKNFGFMWQWKEVVGKDHLDTNTPVDVDGDFYEEQVLNSDLDSYGRVVKVYTIDHQLGDMDMTADSRRPNHVVGITGNAQMYSYTQEGTYFKIEEGKLFDPRNGQFIRNANRNHQVDIVQRTMQLSNDTGRFCTQAGAPQSLVDGYPNPVEACNSCFSNLNIQRTCFDQAAKKIFVRSRIENRSGRSWTTQSAVGP